MRHVGRVIALSVEPSKIRAGGVLLAREQCRLAATLQPMLSAIHAAYEQSYYSSLMPRTYLCAPLLEALD